MADVYCLRCGYRVKPKKVTPGSFLIEVILWIAFIVPGIIYSLWRVRARHTICPECGSTELVPLDSPAARDAIRRRA